MDSSNNNEERNQYFYNPQPIDCPIQYSPYSCPMFYNEPIDDDADNTDDDVSAGFRKGYPRKRTRRMMLGVSPYHLPLILPIIMPYDNYYDWY